MGERFGNGGIVRAVEMICTTLGMIGAGQMATALARGWVQRGVLTPARLAASDPSETAAQCFAEQTGARLLADNRQLAAACETLLLAVKPQHVQEVFAELHGQLGPRHLVISIVAGVTLDALAAGFGSPAGEAAGPRLVRVMSNTPALVGCAASAYALGPTATDEDDRLVQELLTAVGTACRVEERLLDAVTGLSGSGPAYLFLIIEALADGGTRLGLPRQVAMSLAVQTVRGAAELMQRSGEHPAVLRDRVASPGGTTLAGLAVLETAGVRGTLMAAVEQAARRAAELRAGG
jgi:pyrroline-5-carboxylate reductase